MSSKTPPTRGARPAVKLAISRFDRMDLVREACESSWLHAFLAAYQGKYTPDQLLPVAREGVFLYLRERHAPTLWEKGIGRADADEMLRGLAEDVVVLRPRHRSGAYVLAGRWMVSELGDTHDGEYEQAAPPWKRS